VVVLSALLPFMQQVMWRPSQAKPIYLTHIPCEKKKKKKKKKKKEEFL
jgi:hypothetical protein